MIMTPDFIIEQIYMHCFEYGTQSARDCHGDFYERVISAYIDGVSCGFIDQEAVMEKMRAAYDRTISERKTITFRQYYINDGTIPRNPYGLDLPSDCRT